jgi:hypothetical protein
VCVFFSRSVESESVNLLLNADRTDEANRNGGIMFFFLFKTYSFITT